MDSSRHFAIRLTKCEARSFTASHLLTFGDSVVEPLHSHTFYVEIYIEGVLDTDDCVVDFLTLEPIVQSLLVAWQDRILFPTQNPYLHLEPISEPPGTFFRIVHTPADRPIVTLYPTIPAAKVVLLPVKNPSAERLAELLAVAIAERLESVAFPPKISQIQVSLEEHSHAQGICTLCLDSTRNSA